MFNLLKPLLDTTTSGEITNTFDVSKKDSLEFARKTFFLPKKLIKNYSIKNKNILGHSDIAPLRKKDPGEKFPWKFLYKKKLSIWHNLSQKKCNRFRKVKIKDTITFYRLLFKFGYKFTNKHSEKVKILKNFQRRFRPELISSIVDKECYHILKSLI